MPKGLQDGAKLSRLKRAYADNDSEEHSVHDDSESVDGCDESADSEVDENVVEKILGRRMLPGSADGLNSSAY